MGERRSKKISVFFLCLIIGAGFWVAYKYSIFYIPAESIRIEAEDELSAGPNVQIGDAVIAVELATSSAAAQKGLSGRESLGAESGMLFAFSKPDIYRFWMPNMHFPIDIIWLNSHNKVIDIDENVSNEFDPANPVFYTPDSPAQYVLEVNAGFSKSRGINIGDAAIFNHIE